MGVYIVEYVYTIHRTHMYHWPVGRAHNPFTQWQVDLYRHFYTYFYVFSISFTKIFFYFTCFYTKFYTYFLHVRVFLNVFQASGSQGTGRFFDVNKTICERFLLTLFHLFRELKIFQHLFLPYLCLRWDETSILKNEKKVSKIMIRI